MPWVWRVRAELPSEIAAQIEVSERVRLRLTPLANLEAYGFVLQGQKHIFRYTQDEVRRARGLYDTALVSDPRYARAIAAKSRTYNLDWRYAWTEKPDVALDDALSLARNAIDLDESDARGFGELDYGDSAFN